jgi:hypothetical protein
MTTITLDETATAGLDTMVEIDESELLALDDEQLCECLHGENGVGPNGFNHPDDYSVEIGVREIQPDDFEPDELSWLCGRPAVIVGHQDTDCGHPVCQRVKLCEACYETWKEMGRGEPFFPLD